MLFKTKEQSALADTLVAARAAQLQVSPIKANFDLNRLLATHAYLYQDFPVAGLGEVLGGKPGQLREEGPAIVKDRKLETVEGDFVVAYRPMNQETLNTLEAVMSENRPNDMKGLPITTIGDKFANLVSTIDSCRPFPSGNFQTIVSFANQIARDAGIELQFNRLHETPVARDRLTIARDKSATSQALPHLLDDVDGMKKALKTLKKYESQPQLSALMRSIVRPIEVSKARNPNLLNSMRDVTNKLNAAERQKTRPGR